MPALLVFPQSRYTRPSLTGRDDSSVAGLGMTSRWMIGLAPGLSADGVDAALVEVEGVGLDVQVRLLLALHRVYPTDLRALILQAGAPGKADARQLSLLNRLLGETFAAAAREVADRASFSLLRVQCLGCPGQTVWHDAEGRFPSALALGMAAVVAERTGLTTVSDFVARDLAAGGQGVPITSLVDALLFRDATENRVLVHLGGVARIVWLPAGGRANDVIGFDAGPCSLFLDGLMRHLSSGREALDVGGRYAVQGRCLEPLLERWLAHPYFQRRPPRSLPSGAFGESFIIEAVEAARQAGAGTHDLLCTATHLVAGGVAGGLRRFVPAGRGPARVLLSGGGIHNGLLWHLLEQRLAGTNVEKLDCLGLPAGARQPLAFAVLAALTVDGVPGNVPAATGAAGTRLLGSLTPGSPGNWARCLTWMADVAGPIPVMERE